MIDYLRNHPPLVIMFSVVALMLACALIGWTLDYWHRPAMRSVRRESREPVSPAAPTYRERATATAMEFNPNEIIHEGATADWSPREWLDDASDPTDPTLGTGEITFREEIRGEVRGSAPIVAPDGGSVADGASGTATDTAAVPETAEQREARELSEEFDAIVGRLRRQTDQLADDVTAEHLWLLQESEWCVTGLGWAANRTGEYRTLVTA